MDFSLTEDQRHLCDTFSRFCDEQITPRAAQIDEDATFPTELFAKLAELGFFGLRYPESLGGVNLDLTSYCLVVTEIVRGSLSLAAAAAVQSLMGTYFLYELGNDDIHTRLLKPAIQGKKIGSICITEPQAGSDLSAITTSATRVAGAYQLNGQKTWVTSAPVADFFTVFARAGHDRKLTIFLVEREFAGLKVGREIKKMGTWAAPASEVFFDQCVVPESHRLGQEGEGEHRLREVLVDIRIMTGALAIGVARAALDDAIRYAATREQFGRPINRFQAIQAKLANMATNLEAATRLVYFAAWLRDRDRPCVTEAAMAKLFATERAVEICDHATRIFGSYGYAREFSVQRYYRDIRFTLYGGGTTEILQGLIARNLTA